MRSHGPYPKTWPTLVSHRDSCEDVAGRYRDKGEERSGSIPASLTYVLFSRDRDAVAISFGGQVRLAAGTGREGEARQQAGLVTFSFPSADQLRVVVSSTEGQELLARTLEANDYTCERGIVAIRRTRSIGNQGGVGRESLVFDLHPSDNDLIVQQRRKLLGLAGLIIPVGDRRAPGIASRGCRTGVEPRRRLSSGVPAPATLDP